MQKLIRSLFFLLCLTAPLIAEEAYQVIEDQAKVSILTPSLANRKTLKIKLANGLEAYLISDPEATKSAATLVMRTGSWEDPSEYPGLAHFLEHMLFLGTEKYPVESEFDHFIKEHDGVSNAYTSSDHTLYVFSVNNDAFKEALDRFSSFFKKPLFNPSGVARELNAIDQEFAKNLGNDNVREYYVLKELGNPNHPFHRFSAGNSTTLTKVSQKTLRDWYESHYSANLMSVIVYSPLPIETLKKLVVEDFKDIPSNNRTPLKASLPLFSPDQKGKMVYISPIKNVRVLELLWELPPLFAQAKDAKPESVACFVLGHEGEGSLLSSLRKDKLAENLSCAGYHLGPDHFVFYLNIELTEHGLQSVDEVIGKCFQAIRHFKKQGVPSYLFDEIKKMSTLRYQYQSREEPFELLMKMGGWLTQEKLGTFPEQTTIIQKFDPALVQQLLNQLTPQNAMIFIKADPALTHIAPDRKEQWMEVEYASRPVTQQQLAAWNRDDPDFHFTLPAANPFIPKQLNLTHQHFLPFEERAIPRPETIVHNEWAKIYFAQDLYYQEPQTMWFFQIKTPLVDQSDPAKIVQADLYIKCLEDILSAFSYDAKMADLEYEVNKFENGISLAIKGYSTNAELLFDEILKQLKNCRPTEQKFAIFKDSLLRQYQNFAKEGTLQQAFEIFRSAIYQNFSTEAQKAQAIERVNYQGFLDYAAHVFDKTFTEGLFYGNLERNQALNLWQKLHQVLGNQFYPLSEQKPSKIIDMPAQGGPFLFEAHVQTPGHAAILGIEEEGFSFKKRAAQQILAQAMDGPFYATLRTKQQTGYLVHSMAEEVEKHLFTYFAVQSNSHEPRDLLDRFELFIESFLQNMSKAELTEERFETIKDALRTSLAQPPHSLTDMAKLLKTLAFKYEGDFDWIDKRVQGFDELSYDECVKIAYQSLGRGNKRRLAILLHGELPQEKIFQYLDLKNIEQLRQLSPFTRE
jgi:insulysin